MILFYQMGPKLLAVVAIDVPRTLTANLTATRLGLSPKRRRHAVYRLPLNLSHLPDVLPAHGPEAVWHD